ncbi:MAG: indole-3-glycerol phosphate synthase TrpC [Armatimonadetes bacterium]|nr:indole-3-glycerol phosphate synthase TrpC [Armatimonadota bacterium]
MAISQHLKRIYDRKREEVDALKGETSYEEMRARAADSAPPRDFLAALEPRPDVHLIAELKKASPSKGLIRADFDPVKLAKTYAYHGASAISVLTERHFFQGDPAYLRAVKEVVKVPVLRKDFLFDPWQVPESRALGADTVLLIVSMLEDDQMTELAGLAAEYGMAVLIEVHTDEELERVPNDAKLVGINNRNLETFDVTLETARHLMPLAKDHGPEGRIVVAESGIFTREDVLYMHEAGADAILVGESLMRQEDVGAGVRELLGIG